MCCFTQGLPLPDKEHSHRIPQVQCSLIQFPMRNKIRLKSGKRKYLPFANPSSAGERRASHVPLHSQGSDYLLITLPKILLPTALCNAKVEVIWAAQLTSALIEHLVVLCVTLMLLSVRQQMSLLFLGIYHVRKSFGVGF